MLNVSQHLRQHSLSEKISMTLNDIGLKSQRNLQIYYTGAEIKLLQKQDAWVSQQNVIISLYLMIFIYEGGVPLQLLFSRTLWAHCNHQEPYNSIRVCDWVGCNLFGKMSLVNVTTQLIVRWSYIYSHSLTEHPS